MIETNDLGILARETGQETLDFVTVFEPALVTVVGSDVGGMDADVPHRFGHAAFGHFLDDDSPRNDCEVGGERALAAEASQDGVIVFEESNEDLRTEIVDEFGCQRHTAGMSRVVDDVDEEPEEAVDEISPGAWLICDAAFE